jgi:hypothetical protein
MFNGGGQDDLSGDALERPPQSVAPKCSRNWRGLRQSSLESSPERRASSDWRLLHNDKAGSFQMLDEALGNDCRHEFIGVVDAFATLKAQREGERVGDVFIGGVG